MTHIKVPKDRVGAIIGPKGRVKQIIESRSTAKLDIDSENGTVEIIPGEDPVGAMRAEDIVNAIARGFNPDKTLSMFDEDLLMLDVIDISKYTSTQKELLRLKGRIIGKNGKTREITERLTGVKLSVYGKTVSIIGTPERNQIARTAIEMLIEGATHGSVYSYLEKKRQELVQSQLDYY
ncbi:MAG: KH domain-containing protein [Methanolobus sp.]|nr:KH domain-containing protein [Methanolobus sp.]